MQQRDNRKSAEYFQMLITEKQNFIAEFATLALAAGTDQTHRTGFYYSIYLKQLELLIAKYSYGESVASLKVSFRTVIDSLEIYQQQPVSESMDFQVLSEYIESLWLISLALLLEVSDSFLHRVITLINSSGKDAIFDRLIRLRFPQHKATNILAHSKPYLPLYQALGAEGAKREQLIGAFIDNYYKNIDGRYWAGTDKEEGEYFGYWLFELAAFVKGNALDDRSFRTNVCYPRDLLYQ